MADTSLIIQGTCAPGFDHLWEVFGANFAASCPEGDPDLGACVSLTLEGETVVDLWGGFRDAAATQPWTRDTIVCVFSISKAIAAVCMHVMRDRGLLDIDAPVAEFWPEFAQSGKAGITTRMVLSHTAGLLRANVPEGSLWQPGVLLSAIEAMRPEWEPGVAAGYHSFTQGPILQEIARRVTSRSLGQFLRDELARPLDAAIASGLTADEVARSDMTRQARSTATGRHCHATRPSTRRIGARRSSFRWPDTATRAALPACLRRWRRAASLREGACWGRRPSHPPSQSIGQAMIASRKRPHAMQRDSRCQTRPIRFQAALTVSDSTGSVAASALPTRRAG